MMPVEMIVVGCPFCGRGDRLEVNDLVRYPESDEPRLELSATLFSVTEFAVVCNCCGSVGPVGKTPEDSVALWNKREYSL